MSQIELNSLNPNSQDICGFNQNIIVNLHLKVRFKFYVKPAI